MSSLMERMKAGKGKTAAAIKAAAALSGGGYKKDERIWKYGFIKSGKKDDKGRDVCYSDSLIRFLPIPFIDMRKQEAGELPETAVLSPVVHVMRHNFKGSSGQFYNELCRRTIGEECPVNEHDRPLWAKWKEDGKPDNDVKKILMGRIASDEYYANILVIDDKAVPENNGKVFLFKFGAAIKNMIDEAFEPSIPTRTAFDPFDFAEGRDLHLTFVGEERSFNNWTGLVPKDMGKDSKWIESPLCGGDEAEVERVMELAYSLQDFVKPELFKPFDVLKARFHEVMGFKEGSQANDEPAHTAVPSTPVGAATAGSTAAAPTQTSSPAPVQQASEEELDEFERLLREGGM